MDVEGSAEPELREIRSRAPWRRSRMLELYRQPPPGVVLQGGIIARFEAEPPLRLGLRSPWHDDLYHEMLVLSWGRFLLYGMLSYLGLNLIFAGLYLLDSQAINGGHAGAVTDAFFFSVQTMATIGYGVLTPADTYANLVVTAETMVALVFVTFFTGAIFARFSRPTARVIFSRVVTVAPYNGRPTLSVRMTNARRNLILEADVSMTLLRNEVSAEGHLMRRFYDLTLARAHTPIFALSFTAMHPIDEASPLYGATPESLRASSAELLVTVTGLDSTMTQTIHARASYPSDDIRFDHRFADVFRFTRTGRVVIDHDHFHDVEPVTLP